MLHSSQCWSHCHIPWPWQPSNIWRSNFGRYLRFMLLICYFTPLKNNDKSRFFCGLGNSFNLVSQFSLWWTVSWNIFIRFSILRKSCWWHMFRKTCWKLPIIATWKENCPNFAWIFCSKKDTGKMHNKSSQIAFELWKTIGNEPQNDLKMHRKMATTLFAGKNFSTIA